MKQTTLTIAAVTLLAVASAATHAGTITTFTGPWAPTPANGFENSTAGVGTFTTSVSPDGTVLTSHINNAGDLSAASFFLQNYAAINHTAPPLPTGVVSYDYEITLFSPNGFLYEFDDFGNASFRSSGEVITGHRTANYYPGGSDYFGGYFGYFGVNINDFAGTASAVVKLSNFSAPVPETGSTLMFASALACLAAPLLNARRVVRK